MSRVPASFRAPRNVAFEAGDHPGNEIQSPLAIVVLGGLLSAVALNMVVVPALYLRYGAGSRAPGPPDTEGAMAALELDKT